ncbi:alpha/beta hydrolase [Allomuricauda sp. SCSIO 65647]|uniref:alpha/beta hydrolase n=1 Tax=Allomuricauda sp. SCSIO 65647 TaxID=2908843 RepID=UPI001F27E302|nr:esterase [Muricauda sp. SCSIO 65647]UJH67120.1 esterase [Muricauda sp. SCSIO 65647]
MDTKEKMVAYEARNSYTTLNSLTKKTKYVWMAFHGMGFLSRYFLKSFQKLNADEHYIIAPQAPSKYYLNDQFKYVGASWLTKENTKSEIENVLNYANAVYANEAIPNNLKLIIFGFSQGVSIAMRWLVRNQIDCHRLILYAGGIPNEITRDQLSGIYFAPKKVKVVYGDNDHYLTEERLKLERQKIITLFDDSAEVITYEGGHEIRSGLLEKLY